MSSEPRVEAWLRGPLPGIPPLLQPVAHALIEAREVARGACAALDADALWARPGGAASCGYHLQHMTGSLDRLLTYARGAQLDEAQRAALAREGTAGDDAPSLLERLDRQVDAALAQLHDTEEASLTHAREVGRARLPSTVIGLLVHAAEHTARHAGQVVTTARVVGGRGRVTEDR